MKVKAVFIEMKLLKYKRENDIYAMYWKWSGLSTYATTGFPVE